MARDKEGLFITQREINQINNWTVEIIENIIQQKIIYYAIESEATQTDELYGESTKKVFSDPIEIYCRVFLSDHRIVTGNIGFENIFEIEVYFQRDRVMQDLGFYPRSGDYIGWNNKFFEIKTVTEPQLFGGLSQHRIGIICKCVIARQEVFHDRKDKPYDSTINPDSQIKS